jgi:hypothetical protein
MTTTKNDKFYSVKPFLDKINLIFNSILALPLVAFGWLYLEAKAERFEAFANSSTANIINFIFPFVVLSVIGVSGYLFKRKVSQISKEKNLEAKLDEYLRIALMKYAGLVLALVISVIGYYLTLSNTMVVMFVIVLVFFSINKPSALRIANNLNLKDEDKDVMMNKNTDIEKKE